MTRAALPRIEPVGRARPDPAGAVLVLHGGAESSHASGGRRRLAYLRMVPFARSLAGLGWLAVDMLRYRHRGWNAPDADALRDAEWGVRELARLHPGTPVVLLGHSMGGRAALHAAGAPGVVAVCALAPWLDGTDPVEQLRGRTVLVAHGDQDRRTDPRQSYAYALRAKRVTGRVARFEVVGDGHAMLRRAGEWDALVRRFVLGALGLEPMEPDIADALCRPAPAGLRVALTPGRRAGRAGRRGS